MQTLTAGGSSEDAARRRAGWLMAAAMLAVVLFGYVFPAIGYFQSVPGDIGDPRYNSVVLEHLYRVATGYGAGLWNPDFYYPYPGMLALSDNHLGSGLTYVLARLAGLSREHAFDVWFGAGILLNFACSLYALRRFGLSTAAAAVGAFFYACALPVPAQDGHAQFVHRFAAPLAALALFQMFERRRLADLGRVAFFTVWQFYCSIYLGVFLCYLLTALALCMLLLRRPFGWEQWRSNAAAEPLRVKVAASAALLASLLALAYLGGTYHQISTRYALEHWPAAALIRQFLPRLGSYLLADESFLLAWVGSAVEDIPGRYEHQMFIGFGALSLIVAATVAAARGREAVRGLTWPMLGALGLLFVGTLWIGELSLYFLIADLPGVRALRGVCRIILTMLVPMSVLVALGAETALRRAPTPRASALALLGLAALIVIEPLSVKKGNTPITEWRVRLDELRVQLPPSVPADAILFVRTGSTSIPYQVHAELDGMMLAQDLRRPALNGYSAFNPPGYSLGPCISPRYRLVGYARFTGGVEVARYLDRVIVLDRNSCP